MNLHVKYNKSTNLAKSGQIEEPMGLFDEFWFFNNALNSRKILTKSTLPLLPNSTPSNQANQQENSENEEDENEILNEETEESLLMEDPRRNGLFDGIYSKERVSQLRHASSNLGGIHHSWHSAFEKTPPPRLSSYSSVSSGKYRFDEARYGAFQEKKWKSSNDLESIEVQGFKDLGFVFDEEELKESKLANVIPGLREKIKAREEEIITRPYLSEAWCGQRFLTGSSFESMEKKISTTEMKDQLRFWARAVACDVREECLFIQ